MLQHALLVQRAGILQPLDDVLVGVLHVATGKVRHFVGEQTIERNGARERFDAGRFDDAIVVFAERGCLMHEARTGVGGDVIVHQYDERTLRALIREIREQRFVRATARSRPTHVSITSRSWALRYSSSRASAM